MQYNFVAGNDGIPAWDARLETLQNNFKAAYCRHSPDFQGVHGYAIDPPGQANMVLCSKAVRDSLPTHTHTDTDKPCAYYKFLAFALRRCVWLRPVCADWSAVQRPLSHSRDALQVSEITPLATYCVTMPCVPGQSWPLSVHVSCACAYMILDAYWTSSL